MTVSEETVTVGGETVRGVDVDEETRCAHYDGPRDVVAIRFDCCDAYYPCFRCHEAVADHDAERRSRDTFEEPGALCGACAGTLSVRAYLDADDACPHCDAEFNPGCANHYDRYFDVDG